MNLLFLGAGLLTLLCTFFKPSFYWNSRKAMRLRKVIGDTATSIFYYIIGILLTAFGLNLLSSFDLMH